MKPSDAYPQEDCRRQGSEEHAMLTIYRRIDWTPNILWESKFLRRRPGHSSPDPAAEIKGAPVFRSPTWANLLMKP